VSADGPRRLALVGAGAVVTGPAEPGPVRRPAAEHLGVRAGVGIGVEDGRIALLASDADVRSWAGDPPAAEVVECDGRLVTPGLVDCHTHAVFGRPRLEDHARRARGEDYKAIAAAGGGILSSVGDFRGRGEDELMGLTRNRLAWLARLGTTTIEVKSGYGLALEHELKALRVVRRVAAALPLTLVPTFLGAHEVPAEYRGGGGGPPPPPAAPSGTEISAPRGGRPRWGGARGGRGGGGGGGGGAATPTCGSSWTK